MFVLEQEGNIQNQKRSHNKKKILARSIIQFDIRNLFYCLFKTCLFLITLRKTLIYDIVSLPDLANLTLFQNMPDMSLFEEHIAVAQDNDNCCHSYH